MKKLQYNKKPMQSQSLAKPNKYNLRTQSISQMKKIRSKTHSDILNWKNLTIVGNNLSANSLSVNKNSQKKIRTQPQNNQLRNIYKLAINKLMMNVFRKDQVDGSAYIPEKVRYFLGSAFQKIKPNNDTIQQHFYNECLRLFRKSSNDDISEFIQLMTTQKQQQDQKNDISLSKVTIQSIVENRINFSGQQRQMNPQPQKQSRPKSKTKTISNKCKKGLVNTQESQSPEKYQAIKGIKYKKQRKVPKVLGQINNFDNLITLNERSNEKACSYFKGSKNQIKTNNQYKDEQNSKRSFRQNEEKEPCNILQQFVKMGSKDQPRQDSSDKIERLTNRLEGYIRQNAIRLQKSKNARIHLQ